MKIGWIVMAGWGVAAGVAGGAAEPMAFDRYQVILDRMPFGASVAAPVPDETLAPVMPTVGPGGEALGLRASGLILIEGGELRAGLVEVKTGKSYYMTPGESQDGIKLVSADYDKEEIVIQRGVEMAVLQLKEASAAEAKTAGPAAAVTARLSFEERRKAYEEQRKAQTAGQQPSAPPAPRLQGAELEAHLKQYQMEVIRQGMPPLPIPLTPDMDQQLVTEGVLPPQGPVVIQVQQ